MSQNTEKTDILVIAKHQKNDILVISIHQKNDILVISIQWNTKLQFSGTLVSFFFIIDFYFIFY